MSGFLESKRQAIAEACVRHGVLRLDAFGSALRDDFRPDENDLDLLVEFGPMEPYARVDAYFSMLEGLRALLGMEIDPAKRIEGSLDQLFYIAGFPDIARLGLALRPSDSISRAVLCSSWAVRATMATSAPSWARAIAVARPIPRPPPVTIATLPCKLGIDGAIATWSLPGRRL